MVILTLIYLKTEICLSPPANNTQEVNVSRGGFPHIKRYLIVISTPARSEEAARQSVQARLAEYEKIVEITEAPEETEEKDGQDEV